MISSKKIKYYFQVNLPVTFTLFSRLCICRFRERPFTETNIRIVQ